MRVPGALARTGWGRAMTEVRAAQAALELAGLSGCRSAGWRIRRAVPLMRDEVGDVHTRLLVGSWRYVATTQKCASCGERAVDLLCGDGDRVLAATSNDADVRAFDAAVNDSSVNEEGLHFLFLRRDGNDNQPIASTSFDGLDVEGCGKRKDSILNGLAVAASGCCFDGNRSDRLDQLAARMRLVSIPTTTMPPISAFANRLTASASEIFPRAVVKS
jgi:hypothetical protein